MCGNQVRCGSTDGTPSGAVGDQARSLAVGAFSTRRRWLAVYACCVDFVVGPVKSPLCFVLRRRPRANLPQKSSRVSWLKGSTLKLSTHACVLSNQIRVRVLLHTGQKIWIFCSEIWSQTMSFLCSCENLRAGVLACGAAIIWDHFWG